jgi:hypothetical protein
MRIQIFISCLIEIFAFVRKRQFTYNVKLKRFRATIIAVEKQ